MTKKRLSRRDFLKQFGSAAFGVAAFGAFPGIGMQGLAHAASTNNKLLVINFGGGYDTLAVCQPDLGALADIRPTLFDDVNTLALPGTNLSLHPALTTLRDQYNAGNVAICHKVGYGNGSRSHDEAEDAFARGVSDRSKSERRGWINRLGLANFNSIFHVVDLTGGHYTTTQGSYLPTAVRSLNEFGFERDYSVSYNENEQRRLRAFDFISEWVPGAGTERQNLKRGWKSIQDSVDAIDAAVDGAAFNTAYPNTGLGRKLRDADVAFSALNSKVVYTRFSGFDTHGAQASRLNSLLTEFNDALAAFIANMQDKGLWNRVTVLCVSEFARTNRENGNQGTDHGFACDQYLIGPQVRGGTYGPNYSSSDFTGGTNWLNPAINMLDIYRPLVRHLGYDPNRVFENYQLNSLNLFT